MAALFTRFEAELSRLQAEYQVVGLYADPASRPKGGAEGPLAGQRPRGVKTVAEAVGLAQEGGLEAVLRGATCE